MKHWTWSDKLLTEWYQLMITLKLLRLDMRIKNEELEGDQKIVNLICEPRWIWQRKRKTNELGNIDNETREQ